MKVWLIAKQKQDITIIFRRQVNALSDLLSFS